MNNTPTPTPAIVSAARAVAAAQAEMERAATKLEAARERLDLIDGRIANLDAARSDMVARRARGEQRDDDAAMIALNQADREGIAAMRVEAMAEWSAARDPHEAAQRGLETARWQFDQAEAEAEEVALVAHAQGLDSLLQRTIVELSVVGRKLDRPKPAWVASPTLRDALRTLSVHSGSSW